MPFNRNAIERYRAEKDQYFKTSHHSPLPPKLKSKFQGLSYFEIKRSYYFEAPLNRYDNPETIELDTSTGDSQQYLRIGYLEFSIDENKGKIHVYQSEDGHYFVPFRDASSGKETYGAGRYIEVEEDQGNFKIDFNMAYNPFCAYSEDYRCPLPPFENWLEIPILSGEKDFSPN